MNQIEYEALEKWAETHGYKIMEIDYDKGITLKLIKEA